jgi:hypothetical protein
MLRRHSAGLPTYEGIMLSFLLPSIPPQQIIKLRVRELLLHTVYSS